MTTHDILTKFEAYLLTERRVSSNTLAAYRQDLGQLQQFLTKEMIELASITLADLKRFLETLYAAQLSARSVARKLSAIKALFAYCEKRFKWENIAHKLHGPKIDKTLPKYLSPDELDALLHVADADTGPHAARNRVMLYTLYVSGARVSELINLRVESVYFDTGYIGLEGKGGRQRLIPMPDQLMQMIRAYVQGERAQLLIEKKCTISYLFPVCYGKKLKPMSRQAFWTILKNLWEKTGSDRQISPHQLRHSLATHLLKKGANLRSLQLLLGHENLATVQVYTHVETSYLRNVYDKKHPRS